MGYTVKIKAEQTVYYEKIIELDDNELKELKDYVERNDFIDGDDLDRLYIDPIIDIDGGEDISEYEIYIQEEGGNWIDAITGQPD